MTLRKASDYLAVWTVGLWAHSDCFLVRGSDPCSRRAIFIICAKSLPEQCVRRKFSFPNLCQRLYFQHLLLCYLNHLLSGSPGVGLPPYLSSLSFLPPAIQGFWNVSCHRCFHPVSSPLFLRWCLGAGVLMLPPPLSAAVSSANTRLRCCFLLSGETPVHNHEG